MDLQRFLPTISRSALEGSKEVTDRMTHPEQHAWGTLRHILKVILDILLTSGKIIYLHWSGPEYRKLFFFFFLNFKQYYYYYWTMFYSFADRDSFDGIWSTATRYGLDGPGFKPQWKKRFSLLHILPGKPWSPTSLLYNGYRSYFRGVRRPKRDV